MTDTENNELLEETPNIDEMIEAFIAMKPGGEGLDEEQKEEMRAELRQIIEAQTKEEKEAEAARAELLANETPEEARASRSARGARSSRLPPVVRLRRTSG